MSFPFLATLDFPNLLYFTNEIISHKHSWLVIHVKLPSDMPKFNGNLGEYPSTHIMTYHLWCSSNSLMDDRVRLCIFQRSMTGSATKWYIDLKSASFNNFKDFEMAFLMHY
jgi:hypothetical protein